MERAAIFPTFRPSRQAVCVLAVRVLALGALAACPSCATPKTTDENRAEVASNITHEANPSHDVHALHEGPLRGFAHLASGEWTTTLTAGTVLRETWRWAPDGRSLRSLGEGPSPDGTAWREEVSYFADPATGAVHVRGSNSFRNGTFEGTVTFGVATAEAQFIILQDGAMRHLVRRWRFVGNDRFETELLEYVEKPAANTTAPGKQPASNASTSTSTDARTLVPLVGWTYTRAPAVATNTSPTPTELHPMTISPTSQVSLPASHHGAWTGPNQLWIMDPAKPFTSDGAIEIGERIVRYSWAHDGKPQTGELTLKGQPGALKATWTDTFHAQEPFTLHGHLDGDVLRLYTTYDAGEATWGWIIELDFRAPSACTMRMSNVMPGLGAVPAVLLDGRR